MRIDDLGGRYTSQISPAWEFHQTVQQQQQAASQGLRPHDPPPSPPLGFTITTDSKQGVVTIKGTDEADNFRITEDGDGTVTITNNGGAPYTVKVKPGDEIVIEAGEGDDTVDATGTTDLLGQRKGPSNSQSGHFTIDGGGGNDLLLGGKGGDVLKGGWGNDTIDAGAGNDYLDGQDGDDRLTGGDSKDVIYGGDGGDLLYGNSGADYLDGGRDNDVCVGDEGNDTVSGGRGDDYINGGAGADALITTFGKDAVFDLGYGGKGKGQDKIYAKKDDSVQADPDATLVTVDPGEDELARDEPDDDYITVSGSDDFKDRMNADLDTMKGVPVGRQLLNSIAASGQRLQISETTEIEDDSTQPYAGADWRKYDQAYVKEDGTPGSGTGARIGFSPTSRDFYHLPNAWDYTPPAVSLYHELVHADDYMHGRQLYSDLLSPNPGGLKDPYETNEIRTVGLPYDQDGNPETSEPNHQKTTENAFREALNQPLRTFY